MFGRTKTDTHTKQVQANAALKKSVDDYEVIQALKPEVEATVREHRRLQFDNHFAERIWLAYQGDVL